MRVSSEINDKGYAKYQELLHAGKQVLVYLDGGEITHCTIADEEEGFVVRLVINAEGQALVDPATNDRVLTERLTGRVEIKLTAAEE